jgi:hypothetical protein
VGPETFTARAEELAGTARAKLWPKLLAESPSLREFDATTTRRVPLFVLTREYANRWTNPRAASATSRHPWSMVGE